MKKIIALILTCTLLLGTAFVLSSCTDEETDYLIVATSPDFAPMEFVDLSKSSDSQIVGFDILLANYFAKELGKELLLKPMDFDTTMVALQTGSVDVAISGFSWTAARAETFLITDYYVAGENETEQVILTTKAKEGTLNAASDFNGLNVGAQGGSLQQLLVEEQLVGQGATMVKYTSLNDALAALKNGTIDALAVAKGNGDAFISENKEDVGFGGFQFELQEKYKNNVCLVNKNNSDLCNQLNAALQKLNAADVTEEWYNACKVYTGIATLDEAGYDANGNKLDGESTGTAAEGDAALKKPYEDILAAILAGTAVK